MYLFNFPFLEFPSFLLVHLVALFSTFLIQLFQLLFQPYLSFYFVTPLSLFSTVLTLHIGMKASPAPFIYLFVLYAVFVFIGVLRWFYGPWDCSRRLLWKNDFLFSNTPYVVNRPTVPYSSAVTLPVSLALPFLFFCWSTFLTLLFLFFFYGLKS